MSRLWDVRDEAPLGPLRGQLAGQEDMPLELRKEVRLQVDV